VAKLIVLTGAGLLQKGEGKDARDAARGDHLLGKSPFNPAEARLPTIGNMGVEYRTTSLA